jgi:hypothetical protein
LENAYSVLHNGPLEYIDGNGLEAGYTYLPDGSMKPPIDNVPGAACAGAVLDTIQNMREGVGNDKRAHCVHSCEIAKTCGGPMSKCLGYAKEGVDIAAGGIESVLPASVSNWLRNHWWNGGTVSESKGDLAADRLGIDIAKRENDCVMGCEAKYGPEP